MDVKNKKVVGWAVIVVAVLVLGGVCAWSFRASQPEPYRVTPPNGYSGMAEEDKAGNPSTAPVR